MFLTTDLLYKFMKEPTKYVEGVLLGARRAPELIKLLNLAQHFPHNVLKRCFHVLYHRFTLQIHEGTHELR